VGNLELSFDSIRSVLNWAADVLEKSHCSRYSFKPNELKAKYKDGEEISIKIAGNKVMIKAEYCSQFINDLRAWANEIYKKEKNGNVKYESVEFCPLDYFIFEKIFSLTKLSERIFEFVKKGENGKVVKKDYYCNAVGNEKVLVREEYKIPGKNNEIKICFTSKPDFALVYGTSLSKANLVVAKR